MCLTHENPGENILVSVALCTFNGERYIRPQIESLLSQDYQNLEIIICDDCSTDNTVRIISEYKDARIARVEVNETNLGFRRNFTKAFDLCNGELIAPCDQDDIWLPGKISILVKQLIQGRHTMVYCDSEYVSEDGESLKRKLSDDIPTYSGNDPTALVIRNCASGHAMLFRRSVLETALPIPDRQYYDWWIALAAASTGSVQFINEPLVKFRRHASTQTQTGKSRTPTSKKTLRNKAVEMGDLVERIAFAWKCPSHPNHNQRPLLFAAYEKWQTAWVCTSFPRLLWNNRRAFLWGRNNSGVKHLAYAFRFFWGLRTKRLVSTSRYP